MKSFEFEIYMSELHIFKSMPVKCQSLEKKLCMHFFVMHFQIERPLHQLLFEAFNKCELHSVSSINYRKYDDVGIYNFQPYNATRNMDG